MRHHFFTPLFLTVFLFFAQHLNAATQILETDCATASSGSTTSVLAANIGDSVPEPLANATADDIEPAPPLTSETLTLAQAVQEALRANPDLEIVRERLEASRAQIDQARAAFFPRLTASLQYSERESPVSTLGFSGLGGRGGDIYNVQYTDALNLNLPLDVGGKLKAGLKRARVNRDKAGVDLDTTISDVILGTLDACLNHLKAVALLETAREKREALESHRAIVLQRLANDLALKTDLLKAEVQLESSRESELMAKNAIENTRSAINQILGRPIVEHLTIASDTSLALDIPPLEELRTRAFTANPALRAVRQQVSVFKASLKAEQAQHRPNLTLTGSTGRASRDFPPRDNAWSIGGTLDFKVFDGGLQSARVHEAAIRLREAEAQEEKIRQSILVQMQIAYSQFETALSRVEINRKAADLAREELRLSDLQLREGLLTFTDYLDNQAEFTRARVAAIVAEFDLLLARLKLLHLSGGLTRAFADQLQTSQARSAGQLATP
ncbi:MAG TPA: TolC family protein [Candidatus Ozemobacteraceae bacterium]|nr:TolC family protein [Candidatus Ozemobacteraceae bacterium]